MSKTVPLIAIISSWMALAAQDARIPVDRFPVDPQNPTFQDCIAVSHEYTLILLDLHKQNWSCLQQGPKFGYGAACGGGEQYTAFMDCSRFAVAICDVEERQRAAENACRVKADARARQETEERKVEQERQALAERLKKANDLADVARSLPSALSDPKKYFVGAFGANSPILKNLFSSSDFRSDSVRPDLASELYRFAQSYAKDGLQTTSNPLIRSIQEEALKRLGEEHKRILQQADEVGRGLAELTKNSPTSSHQPSLSPSSVKVPTPSMTGCEVFNNEDASRELMQRDRTRWLDLYSKCAQ
jgi:hypothetical protein